MNTHPTIEETIAFARDLHAGQTDKAGEPYIGHVMRVFKNVKTRFPEAGISAQHAALLHDSVEDCDIDFEGLAARGYSPEVIEIVRWVTKDASDGLSYLERIEKLANEGPIGARQVKIADLMDNSDPNRLNQLDAEKAKSMGQRYGRALEILQSAL